MKSNYYSLNKWLQGIKLFINNVKTQAMVIGFQPNMKNVANKKKTRLQFFIGNSIIDLVRNVKYLSVQLDTNLDWNQHIYFYAARYLVLLAF